MPERLVQRHEEGRVVFFAGAGISYAAGLPGFKRLVERIYTDIPAALEAPDKAALKANRFDTVLDLLEHRVGRSAVRSKLWNVLQPDYNLPGATDTHEALLRLARHGAVHRLITTNFDRIFFKVDPKLRAFQAPQLPIPKRTEWDGLVYLHGLLPEALNEETELNRLVVSSGDFGRAYLTERWASRFVTELFRNFSVCFVGYSIDDPILRYMLDAISAERTQGEEIHEMYAFGAYSGASEERERTNWSAKGVTPVMYRNSKRLNHRYLTETIKEWSDDFAKGRNGQIATVRTYARTIPAKIRGDHVVDRMLWAISHHSGIGAQTFADLRPPALIQWLSVFSDARFSTHDLPRFDVLPAKEDPKHKLKFSLLSRPAPYALMPNMSLLQPHPLEQRWDDVMFRLANWLALHLDKRRLLNWAIASGGVLHPIFRDAVRRQLQNPEVGLPSLPPMLRTIWAVLSSDRVSSGRGQFSSFFDTRNSALVLGWTPLVQAEFLRQIRPQVVFRAPFRSGGTEDDEWDVADPHGYADWDLTIPIGQHPEQTLVAVESIAGFGDALVEMLFPLTDLLKQAIDLKAEFGQATWNSDLSYVDRPSIIDHKFNTGHQEWTLLITLCRNAWLEANRVAPATALAAYARWREIDYPLFRRMAFFAAAQAIRIAPSESLDLLLERNAWWFWSNETRREAFQLLQSMAGRLTPQEVDRLFLAILNGPPHEMRPENDDGWQQSVDRETWLRIAKWRHFGGILNRSALDWLVSFTRDHPERQLKPDDRDEFALFVDVGVTVHGRSGTTVSLPRDRKELVNALTNRLDGHWDYSDDWTEICQKEPRRAITALIELARNGVWRADVWRDALNSFRDDATARLSWQYLRRAFVDCPPELIAGIGSALALWLRTTGKFVGEDQQDLYTIVDRVVAASEDDANAPRRPVTRSVNHAVGQTTEALLNWWFTTAPTAGGDLPPELEARFTRITQENAQKFLYGRVILAAQLNSLYLVSPDWTTANLLPRFNWNADAVEAKSLWMGFLWMPRIGGQLLDAFKSDFLATAHHYDELSDHGPQYAGCLGYVGAQLRDHFTKTELMTAFKALPVAGLAKAANLLSQLMGDAGDNRPDTWTRQIKPLLTEAWPKSTDRRSESESSALATVLVLSGEFEDAYPMFRNLVTPTEHYYLPLLSLTNSTLPEHFPAQVLAFLGRLISGQGIPDGTLRPILQRLSVADAGLVGDPQYRRLDEYLQRGRK